MSLITAPDVRQLLRGWLKDQPEVTALCGGRVWSRVPATKAWPAVKIERPAGGPLYGHGNFVHRPLLQLSCYSTPSTPSDAIELADTIIAVMTARFNGPITAGPLSAAISDLRFGGVHEGFDTTDDDRPLARFDVVVTAHPSRTVSS